ncbi:MAG: hypothetical protein U0792_14030 [Gemmataceae bacterium]
MRFCLTILTLAFPSVASAAEPFHFENDILPILGRYGCSASGCHAKAEGQGGFKLSVLGSDPDADYAALTKEGRGRRTFPASPDDSLLLRKGSGRLAHGGGTKPCYSRQRRFHHDPELDRAGMPFGSHDAARGFLRVEPTERVMGQNATQKLKVTAKYSNGVEKDVTRHARFQSNSEGVAAVDAHGLVTTREVPGEAAVMAAYLGEVAVFQLMVPRPGERVKNTQPQLTSSTSFVDAKLAKLRNRRAVGPGATTSSSSAACSST